MVTLALDTSHPTGSVAIARDGELIGAQQFGEPATHLVGLGHAVDHALRAAGVDASTLDRLAVVTGPGSFTGLRIGLSFAKGLHAATGVPMVTIDALRLLALPWLGSLDLVCAMIDARRGEVYAALYRRAAGADAAADPSAAHEIIAPCAVTPATWLDALEVAPDAFVGTGAAVQRELLRARFASSVIPDPQSMVPSTAHLAAIGHRLSPLDEAAVRSLEPLYIRASGAEQKKLRAHARAPEGADG